MVFGAKAKEKPREEPHNNKGEEEEKQHHEDHHHHYQRNHHPDQYKEEPQRDRVTRPHLNMCESEGRVLHTTGQQNVMGPGHQNPIAYHQSRFKPLAGDSECTGLLTPITSSRVAERGPLALRLKRTLSERN